MDWLKQLDQHGFVKIDNFLIYEEANCLRKSIIAARHFKTWDILTTPYYPLKRVKDEISKNNIDKQRHTQACKAYRRRRFSFSFYRTSNKHGHQHGANSIHLDFVELLKQRVVGPLNISGEIKDSFIANFVKGQFIRYHTDGPAGKYAFIYQLSKGWQPKYGGQLELYPRKNRFYKKILQPTFNSLTLLKLDHPMPHSVRILNNPRYKHRLTISGWLK